MIVGIETDYNMHVPSNMSPNRDTSTRALADVPVPGVTANFLTLQKPPVQIQNVIHQQFHVVSKTQNLQTRMRPVDMMRQGWLVVYSLGFDILDI